MRARSRAGRWVQYIAGLLLLALVYYFAWQVVDALTGRSAMARAHIDRLTISAFVAGLWLAIVLLATDRKWWYWLVLVIFPGYMIARQIVASTAPLGLLGDIRRHFTMVDLFSVSLSLGYGMALGWIWWRLARILRPDRQPPSTPSATDDCSTRPPAARQTRPE